VAIKALPEKCRQQTLSERRLACWRSGPISQLVQNEAIVDGENLTVRWKCSGYCRAARETVIEFSIDADNYVPFDRLRCFAYDLRQDPAQRHRIAPVLIGPDGLSKKIAVPFLAPVYARQPFSALLIYELPGCMQLGIEYYTATLSFDQESVPRYSARLIFRHGRPKWLRVYDCRPADGIALQKDLRPDRDDGDVVEYLDTGEGMPGRSVRIYVFSRLSR
jgi:hypothetical protein